MQCSGVIFRETLSVRGVQRGCHDVSVKESKTLGKKRVWNLVGLHVRIQHMSLQRKLQNLSLCSIKSKNITNLYNTVTLCVHEGAEKVK